MATKRMFSNRIIDSDDFLELSQTAQLLYFHLGMKTDDDGFVSGAKRICRIIDVDEQVILELVKSGFLIEFPKKRLYVMTHFLINNTLQSDRYTRTLYQEEFKQLAKTETNEYRLVTEMEPICFQHGSNMVPECFQNGSGMVPESFRRTEQNSQDKINITQNNSPSIHIESSIINEDDYLKLTAEGFSRDVVDEWIRTINWDNVKNRYGYLRSVLHKNGGRPPEEKNNVSAQDYAQREYDDQTENPEEMIARLQAEMGIGGGG